MWIPKIKTSNHYWLNVDSFENIIVTHCQVISAWIRLEFKKKKTPPRGFFKGSFTWFTWQQIESEVFLAGWNACV